MADAGGATAAEASASAAEAPAAEAQDADPTKAAAPRPRSRARKPAAKPAKKANLDRPRKTVADIHGIPSSLDMNRNASAARSGRAEMRDRLAKNTSASPALTSGDVDADWRHGVLGSWQVARHFCGIECKSLAAGDASA